MKYHFKLNAALFIATSLLYVSPSHAITIWDESINGDLSNSGTVPTDLLNLTMGDNRVIGSIGTDSSEDTGDNAFFTVPTGYVLSQVILESYTDGVFYDYVPISLRSGALSSDPLIESILLDEFHVGTNLLQFDSAPGPQPAGIYSFHFGSIQQNFVVDERSQYTVNLRLVAVPEPATMLLFGAGIAGLAGSGLRRKN